MQELVDQLHIYIDSCNASGLGMGGVCFLPDNSTPILLWQAPFLAAIHWDMSSGLELPGTIAHQDILAQHTTVTKCTMPYSMTTLPPSIGSNEALFMSTKVAIYLLQLQALHMPPQLLHHLQPPPRETQHHGQ